MFPGRARPSSDAADRFYDYDLSCRWLAFTTSVTGGMDRWPGSSDHSRHLNAVVLHMWEGRCTTRCTQICTPQGINKLRTSSPAGELVMAISTSTLIWRGQCLAGGFTGGRPRSGRSCISFRQDLALRRGGTGVSSSGIASESSSGGGTAFIREGRIRLGGRGPTVCFRSFKHLRMHAFVLLQLPSREELSMPPGIRCRYRPRSASYSICCLSGSSSQSVLWCPSAP